LTCGSEDLAPPKGGAGVGTADYATGPTNSTLFKSWLYSQGKTKATIRETVNYAKRFGYILDSGDAAPLLTLSPRNKQHTMSALANLAKFQGRYDVWLQIRQRYNLKWTSGNESLVALQRFFNPELSLDHMLQKVKKMMLVLPAHMALVIRHALLTGLRPTEAIESVRLITYKGKSSQYYNPEQQCLEHFRFPEIFLRPTKKAFISYLSVDNYQRIANLHGKHPPPTPP
jgi:hypothetical protein